MDPSTVKATRARNFISANQRSPLVYQSSDGNKITCRLQDGTKFEMTGEVARAIDEIGHELRWAHLAPRLVGCEA
jgi:hypothetical protein